VLSCHLPGCGDHRFANGMGPGSPGCGPCGDGGLKVCIRQFAMTFAFRAEHILRICFVSLRDYSVTVPPAVTGVEGLGATLAARRDSDQTSV
jgi:hypothetical protein